MHMLRILLACLALCAGLALRADPAPAPDLSFLPRTAGEVEIVAWDGYSYVGGDGRTFWSGVETPTAADLDDALATPRTAPLPPGPVPAEVTRRQLFLWLNSVGHTRTALRALLAAIPDATAREAALIEFDEAQTFRRDHPLIAQLGAALGYDAAALDAAFRAAAAL